ncbi:MAG: hypothetical protein HC811_07335 [Flammeovirgaceae bacterium]|nr:hypothetical protein [Flammeovirgaceae bacterium]
MKLTHSICTIILIVIGCVHIIFSIVIFNSLSEDTMWFIGSGLSIIYLGLMNFLFKNNLHQRSTYLITQVSNALLLAFMLSLNVVSPMIPGFVGLFAVMVLIGATWRIYTLENK